MKPLRRAITSLFRSLILPAYFRDIDVLGEPPEPTVKGRLFVSNHVNAILDPILVFATCAPPISPIAKSTLWKVPGMRFLLGVADAVKIVRRVDDPGKQGGSNEQVFDEVAAWLLGGGNILIFPEGTSHNEPHLVPLRSGAARMLERAAEIGTLETLTIQSITLTFDDREQARSRVLIEYGPVFKASEIEASEIEASKSSSEDGGGRLLRTPPRAPTSYGAQESGGATPFRTAFNDRIRQDLKSKLVEGQSWDEFHLISRSAELLANEEGDARLRTWKRWGLAVKPLVRGANSEDTTPGEATGKGPLGTEQLSALRTAINAYFEDLERLGLTDADVAEKEAPSRGLSRSLLLAIALPFALIGILAHGVPYLVTRHFAGRVKSGDETGTIRLGVALALHPPWAAVLVGAAVFVVPWPWSLAVIAVVLASPIATIAWIDALPRIARALARTRHRSRIASLRDKRNTALEALRKALLFTS